VGTSVTALRILVVALRYPPYIFGGYELLARDTVEGLRARGHHVEILCARGERLRGIADVHAVLEPGLDGDEELFQAAFRASNLERFQLHVLRLANVRRTARVLHAVRPDVFFYLNLSLLSLGPLVAARLARTPTLGLVCDPWPLNHWLRFWRERPDVKPLRRRLLEALWKPLRRAVRLEPMLAPSESLRAEFVADGLDPAGVERLPLAMSPEMQALGQNFPARRRAPGEPLRFLCASYLWDGKGVHVFLAAAVAAARAGAAIEVEIAGNGQAPYVARLEALAQDPGLAGHVRFLGALSRAELSAAMGRAHVLAFPSLWGEPYALATLEGMAHGLALLGSDAGGTPEQVEHGISGWIAPRGDVAAWSNAIERLAGDEDLRFALAAAGRARVFEKHTQGAYLDALEARLVKAAGDGPRWRARLTEPR